MILGLDSEDTGLDLHHGAQPFLVTFGYEDGTNTWYEWEVNPLTRKPVVIYEDLEEIQQKLDEADLLILQNSKFDYQALQTVFLGRLQWDWGKVRDTLLAGHLLASNQPHDLTSMVLVYLKRNIQPLEDALEVATKEARKLAPDDWRLAKVGLPEMPSAKEKTWKYDSWVPRAMAKHLGYPQGRCTVVNKSRGSYDVYIGRGSEWGNPYRVGVDGTRENVIAKYREYLLGNKKLLAALPELDGKRLGCHCKPLACHGDVLAELLAERAHPWWRVCADYANTDSAGTLALWRRQEELLRQRGLWRIYEERLKLLPVIAEMESHGVTISRVRTEELQRQYTESAAGLHRLCINLSGGRLKSLPRNGTSNALKDVLLNQFKLTTSRQTPKGQPSLDKFQLDEWAATLPRNSPARKFVLALRGYRRRQTALGYIESYQKFWLPLGRGSLPSKLDDRTDWCILYPSMNPTGTDTLRMSSQNPNEQQISKQEIAELGEQGRSARYMFGPAPGREWWALDYENIELRIPAYESGEEAMIAVFEKPDDPPYYGSYHLLNAGIIYPDLFWPLAGQKGEFKHKYGATWYQWCKNAGFALIYGCQEARFDLTCKRKGSYQLLRKRLPKLFALGDRYVEFANKHGYVETIPDRTMDAGHGYPIMSSRARWGRVGPTVPFNHHVQSTAMWCTGKAMSRCHGYLQEVSRKESEAHYITLQDHDEMIFDFPWGGKANLPKVRRLKALMEQSGSDIGVPLAVSISYHPDNWQESIPIHA